MQAHEQLVSRFYSAFANRDYQAMNSCYSDDIVFFDPVFDLLRGDEVRAMWEMLCRNAQEFSLEYNNIQSLDEEYVTCDWIARYKFSQTGNKVINKVKAHMRIKDGLVIEHSDAFRVSEWASQALGWKGKLFGWTNFMRRKIKNQARKNLVRFMEKKGS